MVWGPQDAAVADLSVLPRAGMPKPPHLDNWGDLTGHSSGASILPRSSSPRAGFWKPDKARGGRPQPSKLQASLVVDEGTCERLGFRPGVRVRTPAGRVARVIGAIQTDPSNEDSWRLWAEYVDKDGARTGGGEASSREQVTSPGTPCSPSGSQGPSWGRSQYSGRRSPLKPGSSSWSPRTPRNRSPSLKTATAQVAGSCRQHEEILQSESPLGPFAGSPTTHSIRLDLMRPQPLTVGEDSQPGGYEAGPSVLVQGGADEPVMSARGFMLPARPVGAKANPCGDVSTPRMTFESDATPYLEEIHSNREIEFDEADYSCFAELDEFRDGQLVWTPCGTVAEVKGSHTIHHLNDPYDRKGARSNPFSALHHSHISGAGDKDLRTRVMLQKVSPAEVRRRCGSSVEFPMERSFKDATWPRDESRAGPFGYSAVTDLEELKWRLQRQRKRQGDAYVNRFNTEDPPDWSPPGARSRSEEYLRHLGNVLYRGARMRSSPAAVATRCGYGPQTAVGPETTQLQHSMAENILSKRRPSLYSPVDWQSSRIRTQAWGKAMFDPAARPHTVRYEHTSTGDRSR